jgi:hypothetical protein
MRARNGLLDAYCLELERDPRTIRRSLYAGWSMTPSPLVSVDAFRDVVGRYQEAGVEEFMLDLPPSADLGVLEQIATDAIPALRNA